MSNRIQADRIDIDRDKKTLVADGKVVTEFEDNAKADASAQPRPPTFTIVKAPHMVYTDRIGLRVTRAGWIFGARH